MSIISDSSAQLRDRSRDLRAHGLPARQSAPWARLAEAAGVALSPLGAALVLRLRLMAPADLPDPAMHTTYIVDPAQVLARYASVYAATARLREGARVGFLVPARLSYLAFGPVPGFLVLRYLFALIAVVPVYLLLRRRYGPPAGVTGILVILSTPVLVTAWGTDYPDSAVVSYAAGAIACLAMPAQPRWRRAWLAAAGTLLTLAAFSHGVAVPLAAATLAGYLAVRLARPLATGTRRELAGDVIVLTGAAAAVTGVLMGASAVLLHHGDFLTTTWNALRYLSTPREVAEWHSVSWRWAPYVAYLLVPPATLGAFTAVVARRGRRVPAPTLMIGVIAAVQLAVYAAFQFLGTVQALEEHYFSSTLWPAFLLLLAVVIAELSRPLADHRLIRWLPPAVLLAVPLAYEADPHVPAFGWAPYGFCLAAVMAGVPLSVRWCQHLRGRPLQTFVTGLALVALTGASLVLTVAPPPRHRPLPGTVLDPPPAYATALGGNASASIANYRIAAQLPVVSGPAAYPGEQLVIWWPVSAPGFPYREYTGMFHGYFNSLPSDPGILTAKDRQMLARRRPAQLMLLDRSAASCPQALRALKGYGPKLARTVTLRSGPLVLHVWLIQLARYLRVRQSPSSARRRPT
jgi:hypothetical protein